MGMRIKKKIFISHVNEIKVEAVTCGGESKLTFQTCDLTFIRVISSGTLQETIYFFSFFFHTVVGVAW